MLEPLSFFSVVGWRLVVAGGWPAAVFLAVVFGAVFGAGVFVAVAFARATLAAGALVVDDLAVEDLVSDDLAVDGLVVDALAEELAGAGRFLAVNLGLATRLAEAGLLADFFAAFFLLALVLAAAPRGLAAFFFTAASPLEPPAEPARRLDLPAALAALVFRPESLLAERARPAEEVVGAAGWDLVVGRFLGLKGRHPVNLGGIW